VASYIIRKIDDALWRQIKVKAFHEERTIKDVIETLLAAWVKEKKSVKEKS
jgi:plasmid stability protein